MARRNSGGVIPYAGKRGVTWSIRYRDADGRRVSETLGSELEGWDRKRAGGGARRPARRRAAGGPAEAGASPLRDVRPRVARHVPGDQGPQALDDGGLHVDRRGAPDPRARPPAADRDRR